MGRDIGLNELECCTVIWYITLYFHTVAGCPEADGGHRGQWIGTLVQGELVVHFFAIP